MPTCSECGSVIDDEYEFCTECGAKFEKVEPVQPARRRAAAPPTPPPPPPPPTQRPEPQRPQKEQETSSKWKIIAILAIVVIVLIASCAIFGILNYDNGNGDDDPPYVVATDPYDGETGVDINPIFIIEFNEDMYQSESIYEALFVTTSDLSGSESYFGEYSIWLDSKTVSIGFLYETLNYYTEYMAGLLWPEDYDIKDEAGNYPNTIEDVVHSWTFTTESYTSSDTTKPYVSNTNPANGNYDIDPINSIDISFSESMYQSTTIHNTLYLNDVLHGYSTSWVDSDTVTITLDATLDYGTTYYAEIKYPHLYEIKDLNDNYAEYVDEENFIIYKWSFTTVEETVTDTTPPYVYYTSPYDGEYDVDPSLDTITITFNEPMYQSTTLHDGLYLEWYDLELGYLEYEYGFSSYWSDSKTVVITLDDNLNSETYYFASLRYPYLYEIKDINGNYVEYVDSETMSIYDWVFDTAGS
jgi:hypothetical protein